MSPCFLIYFFPLISTAQKHFHVSKYCFTLLFLMATQYPMFAPLIAHPATLNWNVYGRPPLEHASFY